MKKSMFTFLLLALFSIGLMTSCTKDNDVKPEVIKSEVYDPYTNSITDNVSEPKKKRKKR